MRRHFDSFLLVVLAVALWEAASLAVGARSLATPWRTAVTLVSLLRDDEFLGDVAATAEALGYAVVLSMLGGVALGVVLGSRRLAGEVMEPILASLYALPKVTLYPLVLLVFGLGLSARVAFGAMHGLVPVALLVMTAVRNIKPILPRSARAMRLRRWQIIWTVLLPATLPDLLAALRLGFSLSLLGVLVGEMFAAKQGLGFVVMNAVAFDDLPRILAVIVLLFGFAILVNQALAAAARRIQPGSG